MITNYATLEAVRNQRPLQPNAGMALATILLLLLVITMLGTLSLRMAAEQHTMSSNIKDLTAAQFAAEEAVRAAIELPIWEVDNSPDDPNWLYEASNEAADELYQFDYRVTHKLSPGNATVLKDDEGFNFYAVNAEGRSGKARRQLEVGVIALFKSESIFNNAFVGCRGLPFDGTATIDSYRSDGAASDCNNQCGDIETIEPEADIELNGTVEVHGSAYATRDIILNNASAIFKDGKASRNINANDTSNLFGNATANGTIHQNSVGRIHGDIRGSYAVKLPLVPADDCDPLPLDGTGGMMETRGAPIQHTNNNGEIPMLADDNRITKGEITLQGSPLILGVDKQEKKYYLQSVWIGNGGSETIEIHGDVTLYLPDSDVISGHGASQKVEKATFWLEGGEINLASDATLTIYINGKFEMGTSARINYGGKPKDFILFSAAENAVYPNSPEGNRVEINSSTGWNGIVYAPNASVLLASSSDAYGAVRGRWASLSSSTEFHYDESLKEFALEARNIDRGYKIIYWTENSYRSYSDLYSP